MEGAVDGVFVDRMGSSYIFCRLLRWVSWLRQSRRAAKSNHIPSTWAASFFVWQRLDRKLDFRLGQGIATMPSLDRVVLLGFQATGGNSSTNSGIAMPSVICRNCSYSNPLTQQYCAQCGHVIPSAGGIPPSIAPPLLQSPVATARGITAFGWNRVHVHGHVDDIQTRKVPLELRLGGSVIGPVVLWFFALLVFIAMLPQLLVLAFALIAPFLFLYGAFAGLNIMMGSIFHTRGFGFNPVSIVSRMLSGVFRAVGSGFRRSGGHHRDRDIEVHDVLINDRLSGRLVLMRIEGYILDGRPSRGHEVDVEGEDHNGTVVFLRGVNLSVGRTPAGAQIRVVCPRNWGW